MNLTLKQYAEEAGVTYEAVRQQVVRYKVDLGDHVIYQGRTRLLDDYAQSFLKAKRTSNPIVVVQQDRDSELEQLRNENKALLLKITQLQDSLNSKNEQLLELSGKLSLLAAEAEHPSDPQPEPQPEDPILAAIQDLDQRISAQKELLIRIQSSPKWLYRLLAARGAADALHELEEQRRQLERQMQQQ